MKGLGTTGLLLAVSVAMLLGQYVAGDDLRVYRGLQPLVPEGAQEGKKGTLHLNVPGAYTAPLYLSPTEGKLVSEWPGGTPFAALGKSFEDGHASWQLVRDPSGNEGWVTNLFLDEQPLTVEPQPDEDYLTAARWDGEIIYCANPAGRPPSLDGDAFVALVERAAARWQAVGENTLPIVSRGRCANDPRALGDGVNTIGWVDDLGLAIAAQAWPDMQHGIIREIDIRLSRRYVLSVQARDPMKTLQKCVFSTLVHEIGHLLGLEHPRARMLPSSMQGFGTARCDKSQPTASDKKNLLRRYAESRMGLP